MNLGLQIVNLKHQAKLNTECTASRPVSFGKKTQQTAPEQTVQKKKVGFFQHIKNFMSGFEKLRIKVVEYTKATFTGLVKGGIVSGLAYAALGLVFNKNKAKAVDLGAAGTIEHATKLANGLRKTARIGLASIPGLVLLGIDWFKASIQVSKKSANVDHGLGTGHMSK